jgi:hypothetical protein
VCRYATIGFAAKYEVRSSSGVLVRALAPREGKPGPTGCLSLIFRVKIGMISLSDGKIRIMKNRIWSSAKNFLASCDSSESSESSLSTNSRCFWEGGPPLHILTFGEYARCGCRLSALEFCLKHRPRLFLGLL